MPELQNPDPWLKLSAKYDLVRTASGLFLSPELVPVVIVDDLSEAQPVDRFATAGIQTAAVAAQQTVSNLINPANSNVLATRIKLAAWSDVTCPWDLFFTAVSGALRTRSWTDPRIPGLPAVAYQQGGVAAPGGLGQLAAGLVIAHTMIPLDLMDFVIPPGQGLFFVTKLQNILLATHWQWSEVPA